MRWVWVCALGVAGLGCSDADDRRQAEETQRTSAAIIDGDPSPDEQDAVVAIAIRPGGALLALCSGTLVAPNLVLTARHCVSDTDECTVTSDYAPSELSIYTGRMGGATAADDTPGKLATTRAAKVVFDTTTKTMCNDDLAFIVLERALPPPYAPIRTAPTAAGESVTAVGFGLTELGKIPLFRRERPGVKVLLVGPSDALAVGDSELTVGESACNGDSGGPLLSEAGAVVAVASRGIGGHGLPGDPAAPCIGANVNVIYTDLARSGDLVMTAFDIAGAHPWLEGQPTPYTNMLTGAPCAVDTECASGVCNANTCARRCDDGTTCPDDAVCTPHGNVAICTPKAPPSHPKDESPPPGSDDDSASPPVTTTTVVTHGCAASGRGVGSDLLLVVAALVAIRRRRASASP